MFALSSTLLSRCAATLAAVAGVFTGVGMAAEGAAPAATAGKLTDPASLTEKAPEKFVAIFETTKGKVQIEVTRAWSPNGADRFYNLVKNGYYNDVGIFRVVPGFMAQMGISGDPQLNAAWRSASIPDDPKVPGISNTRGMVSYAMRGPNTRTTQIFINYRDNSGLDAQGFTPFGKVLDGMVAADSFYKEYGDGAPSGSGPDQARFQGEGNAYLKKQFPALDYIKKAYIKP